MFGDNIQAILDTNLGSLFGLMTQEFTASGQAKTTFTFTPTDLPRQLQNRLLGRLAGGRRYHAGGHLRRGLQRSW